MRTRSLCSIASPHARVSAEEFESLSVSADPPRDPVVLPQRKATPAHIIDPKLNEPLTLDTHRAYASSMTKKLVQHGNSAALIIDKPILDLLNMGMDTPLEITTDGRNIVISPATSHTEDEFLASLDKINSRFSTTLERLAK